MSEERTVEPVPRLALRAPEVAKACGVSRSTLDRLVAAGQFPKPCLLGKTKVWPCDRVQRWLLEESEPKRNGGR